MFSPAFKAWIVEQALQPGMSVASLAMHNQVNANQLRRWVLVHQQRSAPVAQPSRLLPVTIQVEPVATAAATTPTAPTKPVGSAHAGIIIHRDGFHVQVGPDAHEPTLRMVLNALRDQAR